MQSHSTQLPLSKTSAADALNGLKHSRAVIQPVQCQGQVSPRHLVIAPDQTAARARQELTQWKALMLTPASPQHQRSGLAGDGQGAVTAGHTKHMAQDVDAYASQLRPVQLGCPRQHHIGR